MTVSVGAVVRFGDKTPLLMVLSFNHFCGQTRADYGKFTLSYVMRILHGEVPFTINAIPFIEDGKDLPVYALIEKMVRAKAEDYYDSEISSIFIRIYLSGRKESAMPIISDDEIASKLWECIDSKVVAEPKEARPIGHRLF